MLLRNIILCKLSFVSVEQNAFSESHPCRPGASMDVPYHLGASGIFCGLNSGAVGGSRHSVCRPNTLLVESRPSIVTLTVAPSSYEARTPTMSQMLCLTPQCSASCRYSSGSTHLDASVHKIRHKVSLIACVNDTMVF